MDNIPNEAEAELIRLVDRAMRAAIEEKFPDLYPVLAEKYPDLYGPDSLARIKRDFPALFSDVKNKG